MNLSFTPHIAYPQTFAMMMMIRNSVNGVVSARVLMLSLKLTDKVLSYHAMKLKHSQLLTTEMLHISGVRRAVAYSLTEKGENELDNYITWVKRILNQKSTTKENP